MADIGTPVSGTATTLTITINGAPYFVQEQVESVTEQQTVTELNHMAIGTMQVKKAQEFGGWSGRITAKLSNSILGGLLDTIEAAARTGLLVSVSMEVGLTFNDGESVSHLYTDVQLSQTGGSHQRGQFVTMELNWASGNQRVTS